MASQNPEATTNVASQVVESAVALLRAEIHLLASRIRSAGNHSIAAASLTVIAMNLTPVALLVLALSPVLSAYAPGGLVLASAAPITVLAILAWIFSINSWRNVFRNKPQSSSITEGAALERQHGDISGR